MEFETNCAQGRCARPTTGCAKGECAAALQQAQVAKQIEGLRLLIPSGYAIVPIVPTQAMCQAGQWKARDWPKFPLRISPIYQAMLAAAPSADEEGS